ncbi:hypothetical protein H4R20_001230 [Coemansia guatemalensis]|uniref:NADP-dependent oxidoreductase domain-containing protein n=1 Tax=Coemansia guatemalensis TaxID=2761395 RepID=A0A9W8LW69_9FUNG|nr:hypothetical protein H4R20_001230 [Coemansia guatemalensis]
MTIKTIRLNNGVLMPDVGLGTYALEVGGNVDELIHSAIDMGYRHFDCATCYDSQPQVGSALKSAKVPRKELFIVSKIFHDKHRPELVPGALDEILEQLQVDCVDLLLMHGPHSYKPGTYDEIDNVPIMDTWRAMEALLETGKVRAIGVSQFTLSVMKKMVPQCRIIPAVNQIEIHPYLQRHELERFCRQHNIALTAFSPLGGSLVNVMGDDIIKGIAKAHNCTPAQVCLSWMLARDIMVIPRTTNKQRLAENLHRVELSEDEMRLIATIKKEVFTFDPMELPKELRWLHLEGEECPVI